MQVAKVFPFDIVFHNTYNEVRSVPYKAINNNNIKLPNKGKNNGLQNIAFLASFRPRIYPYITKFIASQRPIYVPPILTTGSIVKNKDNGII